MKYIHQYLLLFVVLLFSGYGATAQAVNDHKYKVLFLGNSYTYVNDLPGVLTSAAASAGDTVVSASNCIGGYTLQQHSLNTTSRGLITGGDWDYVVTQEQSQWPSFPDDQVDTGMFPYARTLDSLVHSYNSCGRTMYYMTWGRQNGDPDNCPFWPPVCTYSGMDSMLHLRYMAMADSNDAVVSPVGAVWRYVRSNYPSIALYQADESHPAAAGTYLAACTFYAAIFKRDPSLITYNYTLSATDAANIRTAAKRVVYDSMDAWHIQQYSPLAQFTYTVSGNSVTFANSSSNATDFVWIYGDGQSSVLNSPVHNYSVSGVYTVDLVAINCGKSDTMRVTVDMNPAGITAHVASADIKLMPNPAQDVLHVRSGIFANGPCTLRILNSLGQTAQAEHSTGDADQRLDISGLSNGVYLLLIHCSDGQIWRQVFEKK